MIALRRELPLSADELRSLGLLFDVESEVAVELRRDSPHGQRPDTALTHKERVMLRVINRRIKQEIGRLWEHQSRVMEKVSHKKYDQE